MVVFEGKITIKEVIVCNRNRKTKGIGQVFIKMKFLLEKPSNKKIYYEPGCANKSKFYKLSVNHWLLVLEFEFLLCFNGLYLDKKALIFTDATLSNQIKDKVPKSNPKIIPAKTSIKKWCAK